MRKTFLILLCFVVFAGCCLTIPDYDISIKNTGKIVVDEAHVVYGEFRSAGGILPPGIYAGHGHVGCPIPDNATVEWRTKDGKLHKKEVDLSNVPKDFRGEIRFEIDGNNNVTFKAIPKK